MRGDGGHTQWQLQHKQQQQMRAIVAATGSIDASQQRSINPTRALKIASNNATTATGPANGTQKASRQGNYRRVAKENKLYSGSALLSSDADVAAVNYDRPLKKQSLAPLHKTQEMTSRDDDATTTGRKMMQRNKDVVEVLSREHVTSNASSGVRTHNKLSPLTHGKAHENRHVYDSAQTVNTTSNVAHATPSFNTVRPLSRQRNFSTPPGGTDVQQLQYSSRDNATEAAIGQNRPVGNDVTNLLAMTKRQLRQARSLPLQ